MTNKTKVKGGLSAGDENTGKIEGYGFGEMNSKGETNIGVGVSDQTPKIKIAAEAGISISEDEKN